MRAYDWFGDRSLLVIDIALACCALEFESAVQLADARAAVAGFAPVEVELAEVGPEEPVAILVSGTVTDRVVPILRDLTGRFTRPTVISFGACASSGGPYWDSYAVTKGIGQLEEVDVFVPGCPPPPQALAEVLDSLRAAQHPRRARAGVSGHQERSAVASWR